MLPMDAKRNPDSYSYPQGMLNTGWIAGVLRKPGDGICYIQQTRSENHMLPITFDPRKTPLPKDIKEWDLVMAYCHVIGGKDGDVRKATLKSIRFDAANTMHIDRNTAEALMRKWKAAVHEAAKDSGTPDVIKKLEEAHGEVSEQQRLDSFDWRVMQMNRNASNHIKLAGFIQAKSLERNRVGEGGKPLNDRLIVLLRQTEDSDKCIPIRWYSRNLEPIAKTLQRGMPISVSGEYRVDVKAIGAPDPETGIAPVSVTPYIQAKDVPSPVQPGSPMIKVIPAWAVELFAGVGAKEVSRRAESAVMDAEAVLAQALSQQQDAGG